MSDRERTATRIDLDAVRADTAGVEHLAHFNNAGSALPPRCVTDIIHEYIDAEASMGGYEAREHYESQIADVYTSLARLIGAKGGEIALADSATRAWDMLFYGVRLSPGDRILTTASEYGGNAIAYLHRAQTSGAEVIVVPDDDSGQIDLARLEEELRHPRARLVSLNHLPTQGGLINPVAEVGQLARLAGVPFLVDACQSAGQLELSVTALHCDALTGTGRKYLRGPRGTGFLYVKESAMDFFTPAFLDGRSATWSSASTFELAPGAHRYETWEKGYAGLLGLGAAVDYALEIGLSAIEQRVSDLGTVLRSALTEVRGVRVVDRGRRKSGIVSFTVDGYEPDRIMRLLRRHGINVSVSRARSSRWDLPTRQLESVVRASVHYYNTVQEIELLAQRLSSLTGVNTSD